MKGKFSVIFMGFGGLITFLFGGWSMALQTVLILMLIDFIMGIVRASVFKINKRSENGGLNSETGFKGLCKKLITLTFIIIANRIDLTFGYTFVKDGVCIAITINELISIIENAGLMGIKIPKVINDVIEILDKKQNDGVKV